MSWRKHRCLIHKLQKTVKVTIWGGLADLLFLWAYRLLHIFLPNSTFWPWKCIYMFCYMHFLLNINACSPNYAKNINTKDILCCILFNLSLLFFFFKVLFLAVTPFQPFSCSINSYTFHDMYQCWQAQFQERNAS